MEIAIRAAGHTNIGLVRARNEDAFLVDSALGLYIVADGMGGHVAGAIASRMAVEQVRDSLAARRASLRELAGRLHSPSAREEVLLLIEDAIQVACQAIYANACSNEARRGMGTTVVVCVVLGECAFVSHVGDSRLYLVRDRVVRQVTYDHSVRCELIRRGGTPIEEIEALPYKNAITRAVGTYERAQPESITLELAAGDRLVLATDGLTGYLDALREDLVAYVEQAPEEAAANLVDFAIRSGGCDNVSVVVLHADGDSAVGRERSRRLAHKRETLGAVPLFSKLEDDELFRLLQPTEVRTFSAGDTIVREGDPGEALFVILAGKVRVDKASEAIGVLRAGEVFGEMSLVRNRGRSATVVAVEPSEVLVLHRRDFDAFLRDEARLGVKILSHFVQVLATRLDATSDELSGLRASVLKDD